jgi:hypothetical protein
MEGRIRVVIQPRIHSLKYISDGEGQSPGGKQYVNLVIARGNFYRCVVSPIHRHEGCIGLFLVLETYVEYTSHVSNR